MSLAFDSILFLVININSGYFIRILHVIGSSLFIFFIYLHFLRFFWIRLKIIFLWFQQVLIVNFSLILSAGLSGLVVFISGYILFFISLGISFLGYLLCFGQMSYWGITVMINIVAVLPCCGLVIAELIWSAAWVILNRLFVYHFIFSSLIIACLIIGHVLFLHFFSSCNPFNNNYSIIISFQPFLIKDVMVMFIFLAVSFSSAFLAEPDLLGNSDNNIIANPLTTPKNILPEWYFLIYYSVLRSFHDKIASLLIILCLFLFLLL